MGTDVPCYAPGCQKEAVLRCQRCDRAFCGQHIVGVNRLSPSEGTGDAERTRCYLGSPGRATVWLCQDCAAAAHVD